MYSPQNRSTFPATLARRVLLTLLTIILFVCIIFAVIQSRETGTISVDLLNVAKLFRDRASKPMDHQIDQNTDRHEAHDPLSGYKQWITGVGGDYLRNDESAHCQIPESADSLVAAQTLNPDPLFHGIHHCESYLWSTIFDRKVVARCDPKRNSFDGIRYIEYDDLHHGAEYGNFTPSSQWTELRAADTEMQYVFELKPLTQSLWIECNGRYNHHLSVLPLSVRDPAKYAAKKSLVNDTFGGHRPPNVLIFVLDSTSRSLFARHAPMSMEYLSELQMDHKNVSNTDIFQFFRHSTVAWGTGQNLGALMGGQCQLCDREEMARVASCWGLAAFYDAMGYNSVGFTDGLEGNGTRWSPSSGCGFILSSDVFPRKSCKYIVDDWSEGAELALDAIQQQLTADKDVPYFVPIHVSSNHVFLGMRMKSLDRYVRRVLEYVDKSNTIVHIVADHGSLMGHQINEYGKREMKNPVSIMMVPKSLTQQRMVAEFQNFAKNQQRPVNHYDFHEFFKKLLLKLVVRALPQNMADRVDASLPRLDDGHMLSQSMLDTVVPFEDRCHGIMTGFCFCNVMKSRNIDSALKLKDAPLIQNIVDTVNVATGSGQWLCAHFSAADFVLASHSDDERGLTTTIAVELKVDDPAKREQLLKNHNLLSYSVTFSRKDIDSEFEIGSVLKKPGHRIPNIVRLDYFSKEQCLMTEYDPTRFHGLDPYFNQEDSQDYEPVFVDEQMTKRMLNESAAAKQMWNLRLCRCE